VERLVGFDEVRHGGVGARRLPRARGDRLLRLALRLVHRVDRGGMVASVPFSIATSEATINA